MIEYRSISRREFKDLLEKGRDISGYEIDWILQINFEEIELVYRERLRFSHCLFKYGTAVFNLKTTKEFFGLIFDRCVFEHNGLSVRFLELDNIRIENCTSTYISVSDSKVSRIDIQNTICPDGFSIHESECRRLSIDHDKQGQFGNIQLNSPKLELTHIRGVFEIDRVFVKKAQEVWIRGKISEINLQKEFERVEIFKIWSEEQKEYINSYIKEFKFSLETFQGDLLIREAHIDHLVFSELNASSARVQFKEVSIGKTSIDDCSIPNMVWNQLEFKEPPSLVGTDFSGLKMSNVQWPKNKELNNSFLKERILPMYHWTKHFLPKEKQFDSEITSELKYNIETYRQLKAASIANHNQVEALAFYRNEMKLYWKLVRIEGGILWYDRVLVFVNRWSSDFGQNWFLPLLWMFVFALLFFSCILNWNYFGNNWSGWEEFGQFWVLFNPVHKTPEYINSGPGHFTEFIMRVFTGYFVYHFIKASRKLGRV